MYYSRYIFDVLIDSLNRLFHILIDGRTLTLDGGTHPPYNLSTAVLGPFYTSRVFMRINICMSFHSMHFARFSFYRVYTEKDIRRNWTKPLLELYI